jgi:hypothetical protein
MTALSVRICKAQSHRYDARAHKAYRVAGLASEMVV